MKPRSLSPAAALIGLSLALAGCVTVLPKTRPVQLYRFSPQAGAVRAVPVSIAVERVTLPAAVEGDGLLTMTGDRAAYIEGARWVSPAALLFRDAVVQGLKARNPALVLAGPGEAAQMRLSVRVQRFELVLDPQTKGSGRVVVTVEANLSDRQGSSLSQTVLTSEQPVAAERVGAVVAAFDSAISDIDDKLSRIIAP